MATLASVSAAAQTQAMRPAEGGLSSALVAQPSGLGFSHSLSSTAGLRAPSSCAAPAQRRPQSLSVQAARGTQLFRFGDRPGKGTIILKGASKEDRKTGTRKITTSTKPEEVSAGPAGLFDNLAKLPFANLFRGRQADPRTVFVAGASGVTGTRLVLELLSAGFTVRAGVDESQSAQRLGQLASEYRELVGAENAKRLSLVQSSASDIDFTAKAIANAGKVVIALGADENGPKSSIGAQQAYVLLKAAEQAKSPSFTLITDLSDSGSSDSADGGIFGAVFGFLSKMGKRGVSYAELVKEIVDSDVSYTIVRTGKPVPDSLAATSSIVITQEGQLASGTVSRLQVAQVVAEAYSNSTLAENKVFDVVAREGAEEKEISEQLRLVPIDGRRTAVEAQRAKLEAEAKEKEFRKAAEAEARAVAAEAKAAAESLAALEAEARRVSAEEAKAAAAQAKAQAKAQAAAASVSDLTKALKGQGGAPSAPSGKSVIPSFASLVPDIPSPTPSSVAAAAGKALSFRSRGSGTVSGTSDSPKTRRPLRQRGQSAEPKARPAPAPAAAAPPQKVEKKKIFGVFQQDTIYVDED